MSILNYLKDAGKIADNLSTTRAEDKEFVIRAMEIDVKHGNWLTKSWRPVVILALTFMWIVLSLIIVIRNAETTAQVLMYTSGLLISLFSVYSVGRTVEKSNAKISTGLIKEEKAEQKLEEMEVKHELQEAKREARHKRRLELKEQRGKI